jgi:hypothetical protein
MRTESAILTLLFLMPLAWAEPFNALPEGDFENPSQELPELWGRMGDDTATARPAWKLDSAAATVELTRDWKRTTVEATLNGGKMGGRTGPIAPADVPGAAGDHEAARRGVRSHLRTFDTLRRCGRWLCGIEPESQTGRSMTRLFDNIVDLYLFTGDPVFRDKALEYARVIGKRQDPKQLLSGGEASRTRTLSGRARLVASEATTLTFHAPEDFVFQKAEAAEGVQTGIVDEPDGVLRLKLRSEKDVSASWKLKFRSARPSRRRKH